MSDHEQFTTDDLFIVTLLATQQGSTVKRLVTLLTQWDGVKLTTEQHEEFKHALCNVVNVSRYHLNPRIRTIEIPREELLAMCAEQSGDHKAIQKNTSTRPVAYRLSQYKEWNRAVQALRLQARGTGTLVKLPELGIMAFSGIELVAEFANRIAHIVLEEIGEIPPAQYCCFDNIKDPARISLIPANDEWAVGLDVWLRALLRSRRRAVWRKIRARLIPYDCLEQRESYVLVNHELALLHSIAVKPPCPNSVPQDEIEESVQPGSVAEAVLRAVQEGATTPLTVYEALNQVPGEARARTQIRKVMRELLAKGHLVQKQRRGPYSVPDVPL
jgi:hypothetical protein